MANFNNIGRQDKDKYLKDRNASNAELLLHPELLSLDFIQLVLKEKNITTGDDVGRDQLTELYLRHAIPLPQRPLPNNRWGRRMERTRPRQNPASGLCRSNDHNGRRPQIVFDGSTSKSVPVPLKTPQGFTSCSGRTDRLKPPPSTNPLRKLSSTTVTSTLSSTLSSHISAGSQGSTCTGGPSPTSVLLKRQADSLGEQKSPEMKKKIQKVTWP